MAKTKKEKKEILNKYLEKLNSAKIVVVLKHSNLSVTEITELKKSLYQTKSTVNVIKNRLMQIALNKLNLDTNNLNLKGGQFMFLFSSEYVKEPLEVVNRFIEKVNDKKTGLTKLEINYGILDNNIIGKDAVDELSRIPDIKVSMWSILNILDLPIKRVIETCQTPLQYLLLALEKVQKS